MGHHEKSEGWGRKHSMTSHMWSCCFGGLGPCKVAFLTALLLCFLLSLYDVTRWVLLQRRVGHLEKPFRISLEYVANGNKSVAAVDSFAMKNCSTGSTSGSKMALEGSFSCWNGTAIRLGQACDFIRDCAAGEDEGDMCKNLPSGFYCSFEEGDCGWMQGSSVSHPSPWQIGSPEHNRFPSIEGYALLLNTSKAPAAANTVMTSTAFPAPLRNSPLQIIKVAVGGQAAMYFICSHAIPPPSLPLALKRHPDASSIAAVGNKE
ncbi:ALK tyrosine kinase receptor-like [Phalacrocorax aristotelis]|uniref:ALK tyrosine kinase receptor-like n=1 Tax=Phalacrocorax aristotelis TaxID=126867 RepID=UPI003F4BBBF0